METTCRARDCREISETYSPLYPESSEPGKKNVMNGLSHIGMIMMPKTSYQNTFQHRETQKLVSDPTLEKSIKHGCTESTENI
jgi:hypothetical protein